MLVEPSAIMSDLGAAAQRPQGEARPGLHLLFGGDEFAVRNALSTTMTKLRDLDLDEGLCSTVEIVLAEVLNNVVEHAFANRTGGLIEMEAHLEGAALTFHIRDDGHPLPDGAMPEGTAQNLDVAVDDLPEGGFGWLLIRELTEALAYRRTEGRNQLSFTVPRPHAAA